MNIEIDRHAASGNYVLTDELTGKRLGSASTIRGARAMRRTLRKRANKWSK